MNQKYTIVSALLVLFLVLVSVFILQHSNNNDADNFNSSYSDSEIQQPVDSQWDQESFQRNSENEVINPILQTPFSGSLNDIYKNVKTVDGHRLEFLDRFDYSFSRKGGLPPGSKEEGYLIHYFWYDELPDYLNYGDKVQLFYSHDPSRSTQSIITCSGEMIALWPDEDRDSFSNVPFSQRRLVAYKFLDDIDEAYLDETQVESVQFVPTEDSISVEIVSHNQVFVTLEYDVNVENSFKGRTQYASFLDQNVLLIDELVPGTEYRIIMKVYDRRCGLISSEIYHVRTLGEHPVIEDLNYRVTRDYAHISWRSKYPDFQIFWTGGYDPYHHGSRWLYRDDDQEFILAEVEPGKKYSFFIGKGVRGGYAVANQEEYGGFISDVISETISFVAKDDPDLESQDEYNRQLIFLDSDQDGLSDYVEKYITRTDRDDVNTDEEGGTDYEEVKNGWNPLGKYDIKTPVYRLPHMSYTRELQISQELRDLMQQKGLSTTTQEEWYAVYFPYAYGEYPFEDIEQYIKKDCEAIIHPEKNWHEWKDSEEYKKCKE